MVRQNGHPDQRQVAAEAKGCEGYKRPDNTTTGFPSLLFLLYYVFLMPGVKLTDATTVRLSGGVALLVRKELSHFIDQIHTEYDNVIILKLSKELLGTESEVMLQGSYTSPANSVHYKETEITNGITKKQILLMVYHSLNNALWML